MILSNHLILCCPLLLPSVFPSIRIFPNKSVLHIRWPKYIGASVWASVLPVNIQGWFPLRWTSLVSLLCKGLYRVFSSTTVQTHQFFSAQSSLWSSCHICTWLLEKLAFTRWTSVGRVISVLFNMLSRFVIAIIPRSKHLLVSWLLSLYSVILEPKKI